MSDKLVLVRIPSDVRDALKQVADTEGRTLTGMVKRVVLFGLEKNAELNGQQPEKIYKSAKLSPQGKKVPPTTLTPDEQLKAEQRRRMGVK